MLRVEFHSLDTDCSIVHLHSLGVRDLGVGLGSGLGLGLWLSELVAVGVSPVGVDRGVTLTLVLQDLTRLWQLLLLESLLEHFLDLIRGREGNVCSLLGLCSRLRLSSLDQDVHSWLLRVHALGEVVILSKLFGPLFTDHNLGFVRLGLLAVVEIADLLIVLFGPLSPNSKEYGPGIDPVTELALLTHHIVGEVLHEDWVLPDVLE